MRPSIIRLGRDSWMEQSENIGVNEIVNDYE